MVIKRKRAKPESESKALPTRKVPICEMIVVFEAQHMPSIGTAGYPRINPKRMQNDRIRHNIGVDAGTIDGPRVDGTHRQRCPYASACACRCSPRIGESRRDHRSSRR